MTNLLHDLTDTTFELVLFVIFVVSTLISIKLWLERQAIRRGGRVPGRGGGAWPIIAVVSAVILAVIR